MATDISANAEIDFPTEPASQTAVDLVIAAGLRCDCYPTCYDAAGNMTSFYDGLVTHHYTYDAENRLTGVDGTTQYTYDAESKRIGVYANRI